MSQSTKLILQLFNCTCNISRLLCLLIKGSNAQNKKIKNAPSSFSVILRHA